MQKSIRPVRAIELIDFLNSSGSAFDHMTQFAQVQCLISAIGKAMPDLYKGYLMMVQKCRDALRDRDVMFAAWKAATPTADAGDIEGYQKTALANLQTLQQGYFDAFSLQKNEYETAEPVTIKCNREDVAAAKRFFEKNGAQFNMWQFSERLMEIVKFFDMESPSTPDDENLVA